MTTRSKYTPPIGAKVRFSTCGTIATVTGHTERGFTYKDGPVHSIPRWGIMGTGEGEVFTDIPGWDSMVIQFKPEVTADDPTIPMSNDHSGQPAALDSRTNARAFGHWLRRWVRGFFVCEACGLPAFKKCTFVERHGDGLHDQWDLCADCSKLYIETLQKLLYSDSSNDPDQRPGRHPKL